MNTNIAIVNDTERFAQFERANIDAERVARAERLQTDEAIAIGLLLVSALLLNQSDAYISGYTSGVFSTADSLRQAVSRARRSLSPQVKA